MISEFFDRFRRERPNTAAKTMEELEREFDQLKVKYATVGNSELYKMLKDYFLVKIEITRDILELTPPTSDDNKGKVMAAQAEIKAMRDFIQDIEAMMEILQQQSEEVVIDEV